MAFRFKKNRLALRLRSYGFMLINTVVWGAALVIVKPSLDVTTPSRYLLYRFFIAGIVMLPVLLYYVSKIKKLAQSVKRITLIEIIGTSIALPILYTGLAKTGAIEASLIATTGPIFIVLVGIWLLKEKEENHEWVGLGLAFLGTLLITVLPALMLDNGISISSLWGNGMIILYNIVNGFYYILAKKWYKDIPKLFVSTISFYVGIISFLFLSLRELAWSMPTLLAAIRIDWGYSSVQIASIYMAIFGSVIGLTAYIKGQDGIEASEASVFSYLQPLVYVPLGFLLLGETISQIQLLGLMVVILGVIVAGYRSK